MMTESDLKNSQVMQFSTFYLGESLYGIDVMRVQEITKPLPMSIVRLASSHVKGLINLRGQIATAISLGELFDLKLAPNNEFMNVVCRIDGNLLSLLVDRVGDVVEVSDIQFEALPDTIRGTVRRFIRGVYKLNGKILTIIDIDSLAKALKEKE